MTESSEPSQVHRLFGDPAQLPGAIQDWSGDLYVRHARPPADLNAGEGRTVMAHD